MSRLSRCSGGRVSGRSHINVTFLIVDDKAFKLTGAFNTFAFYQTVVRSSNLAFALVQSDLFTKIVWSHG